MDSADAEAREKQQRRLSNEEARRAIRRRRPFAVRAIALLLLLQGGWMVVSAANTIDWTLEPWQMVARFPFALSLIVTGALSLAAALSFVLLRSWAWLQAMLSQSLYLLSALLAYLRYRPEAVDFYGMMLLSVVLVIYLNYADVPALFRGGSPEAEELDYE